MGNLVLTTHWERVFLSTVRDYFRSEETLAASAKNFAYTHQFGGYPVLEKWLGYRQAIQRIAALHALGSELNALYQLATSDSATATELGIER